MANDLGLSRNEYLYPGVFHVKRLGAVKGTSAFDASDENWRKMKIVSSLFTSVDKR